MAEQDSYSDNMRGDIKEAARRFRGQQDSCSLFMVLFRLITQEENNPQSPTPSDYLEQVGAGVLVAHLDSKPMAITHDDNCVVRKRYAPR